LLKNISTAPDKNLNLTTLHAINELKLITVYCTKYCSFKIVSCDSLTRQLGKKLDFGHFISLHGVNSIFSFTKYIHRVHPNKSPLKIWGKGKSGRIQGILYQEQAKFCFLFLAARLLPEKFSECPKNCFIRLGGGLQPPGAYAYAFTGFAINKDMGISVKACFLVRAFPYLPLLFVRRIVSQSINQSVYWRIQGLPKFLEYPLLSQERVKLRTSNLAGIFTGFIRTKTP